MKIIRSIVTITLLSISVASARLGESVEQCQTRYGKETTVDDANHLRMFRKDGLIIATIFLDGTVASITYLNAPPTADPTKPQSGATPAAPRPVLTQEQIQRLLSINRGSARAWGSPKKTGKHTLWWTSDSKRSAVHDPDQRSLTIQTEAFLEHQKRILAAKEKAAATKKSTTPAR